MLVVNLNGYMQGNILKIVLPFLLISLTSIAYRIHTESVNDLAGGVETPIEPIPEKISEPDTVKPISVDTYETANFKQKYGKYIQVTKDGRLLNGEQEISEPTFKKEPNTTVDVWKSEKGSGYQIIKRGERGYVKSTGYSEDDLETASSLNWEIIPPPLIASST